VDRLTDKHSRPQMLLLEMGMAGLAG
jgi:hypothetical protein